MFKKIVLAPAMRRRTSWIVATVLLLPFILFFHASGRAPSRGPGGTAGVVFGTSIPWEDFQQQRLWVRRQWQNRLGQVPDSMEGLLTQYTWDRFMLLEEARHRHVRVEDRELATFIQRLPPFQERGRFVPEHYYRFLQAMNISPQLFESLLRDDLLIEKLINSVKASVSVTDDDVKAAYRRSQERLKASVIVFEVAAFVSSAEAAVTEEEIHTRYDAHPEEVRVPEQIRLEYAGASHDELASTVQLSEEDLRQFYQDEAESFKQADGATKPFDDVKETVRRQLTEQRVTKQLTALALDLQEDVEAKLRFEEIVTSRALASHTAGPLPAGHVRVPNGPEPELLQAVAELPEGQLSEVIRTDHGVYLARVTQRILARVPPLDEVRMPIRQRLVQERAKADAKKTADDFHNKLNDQLAKGMRFEEAMLAAGLTARSATFTRADPIDSIGTAPNINEAAFETPLGELTEVLEAPNAFIVLRPEERLPVDESRFAQEQNRLREETLTRKQSEAVEAWLQDVRGRAKIRSFVDLPPSAS